MALRRHIAALAAAGALAAALLAGCDGGAVEPGATRDVVFDVAPLVRNAAGEPCVSVVETLTLTVTEADGTEQVERRTLAADDTEVRIPVEVEAGEVTFEAEVVSNNGTRLYTGSVTAAVGADGFLVEVPLASIEAVLRACPAPVPLVLSDDAYRGTLDLENVGARATSWAASVDPPLCDGEPCFAVIPSASEIAAGETIEVGGVASTITLEGTFDVQIVAPVGTLDVPFVVDALVPVPGPDVVTVFEGETVEVDVLANDVDPEGDPLTLISVGPAAFGTTEQDDDLAFYTADYTPVWAQTSEDGFRYVVDAGGRRAEGEVAVQVAPCLVFEEPTSSEVPGVALTTENGVTAFTRTIRFDADTERYVFTSIGLLPQSDDDLGIYLFDASIEFDWTQQPVRYVRVDFLDDAATLNLAFNGGERIITTDLTPPLDLPPGITPRLETGKFGPASRLILEASADAPIERLLLGGGEEDGDQGRLILDDVCFGLAPLDN